MLRRFLISLLVAAVVDDKDYGAFLERHFRPGEEVFCAAADLDPDLPWTSRTTRGDGEHAYRPDRGFVAGQRSLPRSGNAGKTA